MSVYKLVFAAVTFCAAVSLATPLGAQSLAELARQTRAKKQQAARTDKVFTNDSIPAPAISGAPAPTAAPAAAAPSSAAASPAQPSDAAAEEGAAEESAEPTLEELEKEYRDRFAGLKQNLDTEERRLDVLQRELNLAQQQFYSDPNVAMREQYNREEINKRLADIETQKTTVENAKQAIADLEDELRRKSLPPGWAR